MPHPGSRPPDEPADSRKSRIAIRVSQIHSELRRRLREQLKSDEMLFLAVS